MKTRNLMLTGFGLVLILWLGSTWINRNDSDAGGEDSAVTGVGIFSEDPDRLNLSFWDDRQDAKLFNSQYLKQELGTGTGPDQLEPVDDLQDGRYFDQFYTAE